MALGHKVRVRVAGGELMVIVPPYYTIGDGPTIFLAGPIQGAPNWQAEAMRMIAGQANVASPRRTWSKPDQFEEQVEWETFWLTLCAKQGIILFWLANQVTEHPERVYAQTTRFELGEWITKLDGKIALGIDSEFQGARYIRHRAKHFGTPIFDTLGKTVMHAVQEAHYLSGRGTPHLRELAFAEPIGTDDGGYFVTLVCGHRLAVREKKTDYLCRECK